MLTWLLALLPHSCPQVLVIDEISMISGEALVHHELNKPLPALASGTCAVYGTARTWPIMHPSPLLQPSSST